MNVIWHDYEGMQLIVPEEIGVVVDGFHNHVRDGRLAEVDRSSAGFVQQSIHNGKCRRQIVVETPCEEDRAGQSHGSAAIAAGRTSYLLSRQILRNSHK